HGVQRAVSRAINGTELFLGHVLNRDRQLPRVAGDAESWNLLVIAVANIVVSINKGQRALRSSARILQGDQNAVWQPAWWQHSSSKIGGGTTSRQHNRRCQSPGGAKPKTSLLQNLFPRIPERTGRGLCTAVAATRTK